MYMHLIALLCSIYAFLWTQKFGAFTGTAKPFDQRSDVHVLKKSCPHMHIRSGQLAIAVQPVMLGT